MFTFYQRLVTLTCNSLQLAGRERIQLMALLLCIPAFGDSDTTRSRTWRNELKLWQANALYVFPLAWWCTLQR
jgi:hypothetical protein